MDSEIAALLPRRRHERWIDLGFRLAIVLLAAFWLFAPPAAGGMRDPGVSAALVTH